jgi:hypothetical protein
MVTGAALITSKASATAHRAGAGARRRHLRRPSVSPTSVSILLWRSFHETTPTTTSNGSTIGTPLIR